MNQRAEDLLMARASEVTPKQLRELHIRLNPAREEITLDRFWRLA